MRKTNQAPVLGALRVLMGTLVVVLGGCVGPPALERAVLGYDEVNADLEQKLLLLNIARWHAMNPVHFSVTSSIAATFDWTTTVGVGGDVQENPGFDSLSFNWGASASENPTFSITPVSGKEFTERLLTPYSDDIFEFIVFQGGHINRAMRLMGAGFFFQKPDGTFLREINNDPLRPKEYKEFRQLALHLQSLWDADQLFVRSLVFEETLVEDFKGAPSAADINQGLANNLRWRQKPDGSYKVTRLTTGRSLITNYDPQSLTDEERWALNEKIKRNLSFFVYVDVRPEFPGGRMPIQGVIKLRSMVQMLDFIAEGIERASEFDVDKDPRTARIGENPRTTLQVNVSGSEPSADVASIKYRGEYYSIGNSSWDRRTFRLLLDLFQLSVAEVKDVGLPITIAK